jgi:hypothetical protein
MSGQAPWHGGVLGGNVGPRDGFLTYLENPQRAPTSQITLGKWHELNGRLMERSLVWARGDDLA